MGKTLLDSFIDVAPYINDLTVNDTAVAITDKEKYLCYHPGESLDHNVRSGNLLKEGSLVKRAMSQERLVVDRVGADLFGIAYIGLAIPVRDKVTDEVIGSVFFGVSTERQDELREMADGLFADSQQVSESTQQISAQSEELASLMEELDQLSNQSQQAMEEIDNVVGFIKEISTETNLLGFNAAIEAARVGSAGSGFTVVANEIRKLSDRSSQSVNDIESRLANIKEKSEKINQAINSANAVASEQASIMQSIAASVEEINMMVEKLSQMADSLSKK